MTSEWLRQFMQERAAVFLLVLAWSVEFLVAWSTGFHLLVAQIGWMRPMHWAAGNGQRQAAEELRDLVWRAVSKRVLGWPPNAAGQSRGGFVYKGSICFLSRHGDLGCIMCILSISEPDKFSEAPS
ncbi:unnamed protein product [Durusdinium trenchii]|uniref:Uncharacterized protein n=1 Tax=Durusdinium trenchii TaxID=1381693 RepID=A0ABP0HCD9_9DINO